MPLRAALAAVQFHLSPQDTKQPRIFPGLLNKIAGSAAHRFDSKVNIAPRCHDNDGQLRIDLLDAHNEIHTLLP